jgi:signal peptidase I
MSSSPISPSPTSPSRPRQWLQSIVQFACIFAALTVAKMAFAEPYYVPSGSMEPTLLIGDELLATKYTYGYSSASLPPLIVLPPTHRILASLPERGDVVVFRAPVDRSQVWVKRVIGLPGDRIALRSGKLWLNGAPVALRADGIGQLQIESGASIPAPRYVETLPGHREHTILKLSHDGPFDNMAEVTVPLGHLFVMGDNRDNSADSRVPVAQGGVGMLPADDLIGRARTLIGSWDTGVKSQPLWTWPAGLRLSRFFTAIR